MSLQVRDGAVDLVPLRDAAQAHTDLGKTDSIELDWWNNLASIITADATTPLSTFVGGDSVGRFVPPRGRWLQVVSEVASQAEHQLFRTESMEDAGAKRFSMHGARESE